MNLIIVESPTKARTLTRFLGKDFTSLATLGHIKDLPKSKLAVDIKNNFKPDYVFVEKRKETVDQIKSEAKGAKAIYIATDPDREGEAIALHVKDVLTNNQQSAISNQPLRVVFHEITKEAVEKAISNPRDIDENLVDAQIARRVLDRLVGYHLSPLLWKKIRRGLSAGRVQSVALRLIVEREREIDSFKQDEYWEIYCQVKSEKLKVKSDFVVQLIKVGDKKAGIKDKNTAELITAELKKARYKVLDIKKSEVVKNPYAPFTTSTLTQAAARLFFWSAKRTMTLAQRLYEEGLITYHRTDSTNLSQSAVVLARGFIKKEYGDKYLPASPRIYKTKSRVAQEAHEAIRPTDVNSKFEIRNSKFGSEAARLYDLIWRRFVSCQMASSIYDETTIEVEAIRYQQSAISYLLRASGQVMKFDGWTRLRASSAEAATKAGQGKSVGQEIPLPEVKKGESLQLIKVDPQQKFTQPPLRYNEALLIKTLEKLGIGRPSTYAPTISTIQVRQYVEKEEGKFVPTHLGVTVSDFLVKNFEGIVDYKFTADMEGNLDEIANGKVSWVPVIKKFWGPFETGLSSVEKKAERVKVPVEYTGEKCPKCEVGDQVLRVGRFGKFLSCSRFPDCDWSANFVEKTGNACPKCKTGEVIIKKTKKGRKFYGCSRYPDCDWASWRKPEIAS